MTTHVRQQILTAMQSVVTGLSTTGSHVYLGRVTPLPDSLLPALNVRAGVERTLQSDVGAPRLLERALEVWVEVYVKVQDALDSAVNAILLEVEPVLAMPNAIAGVNRMTLIGIEEPHRRQGEEKLAVAAMRYEVVYITQEDAPATAR